jgi:hypothetical protein
MRKMVAILTRLPQRAGTRVCPGKAAGKKTLEAYFCGYVEGCFEPRTQRDAIFSCQYAIHGRTDQSL